MPYFFYICSEQFIKGCTCKLKTMYILFEKHVHVNLKPCTSFLIYIPYFTEKDGYM